MVRVKSFSTRDLVMGRLSSMGWSLSQNPSPSDPELPDFLLSRAPCISKKDQEDQKGEGRGTLNR